MTEEKNDTMHAIREALYSTLLQNTEKYGMMTIHGNHASSPAESRQKARLSRRGLSMRRLSMRDRRLKREEEQLLCLPKKRLRLLGEIACGAPILAEGGEEAMIEIRTDLEADFCLRASGDSMTGSRIYDGDLVLIREQPMVENGEIAAVLIKDEATLKRVYYYPEKKRLILYPDNPSYTPLVFMGEELADVRVIGKAVALQTKLI